MKIQVTGDGVSGGGDEKGSDSEYLVSPCGTTIQFTPFAIKALDKELHFL